MTILKIGGFAGAAINSWYKAIFERYSVRNYNGDPINSRDLDRINNICTNIKDFKGVRAILVNESTHNIFKGLIGSYGKIKGAPAYIAFIGDMTNPNIYEILGYVGEGIILEATSMGLGTCWISGTFDPKTVKAQVILSDNEKILAITPIGYAAKELTFDQKLMFKLLSKKRKTIEDITEFDIAEEWIKEAIDSSRMAPSAVNRQPWRFANDRDNIIIKVDKEDKAKFSKRLDCGIAMLHFELGALSQGVNGHWDYLQSPNVAKFVVDEKLDL